MMLADHGAQVIRIDRPAASTVNSAVMPDVRRDFVNRSRRSIGIDLKHPAGIALIRKLARAADGLIEGFRPGVMERLGLGPDILLEDNPRLVYARMTGWGQTGPNSNLAGHDINYIALSGALHSMGRAGEKPVPPLNMVGDYGGGGMMVAFGMLAAILHARSTGEGQVVDCAMTEGSAVLMTAIYSSLAAGLWSDERGVNLVDSGAPFYDSYETGDGRFVAIGPIEPQFFRRLLQLLGVHQDPDFTHQFDRSAWPAQKAKLTAIFKSRSRAEWDALLAGADACYAPILTLTEAPEHPHNIARGAFVDVAGAKQPAPAPRYSKTPAAPPEPLSMGPEVTESILANAGIDSTEIQRLMTSGVVV
jgi:alpha-methylacyl-CoA racemase